MKIYSEIEKIQQILHEEEKVVVRIALFGQSGAGKSSIINKLIGQKVAITGVKTDTTKEAKHYEWEGVFLVDLPGYSTKEFSARTYFEKFDIINFDLFVCVLKDRISEDDVNLFQALKQNGKICLFVRNKHDEIWCEDRPMEELEKEIHEDLIKQIKSNEEIYFTSSRKNYGFDKLSNAIFNFLDESKKTRWIKSAKAYSKDFLVKKKGECERLVTMYAGISSVNALNPIPGLDVSMDIGTLIVLFQHIRNTLGLTEGNLEHYKKLLSPSFLTLLNQVVSYATKEGIILLLKQFLGREILKGITKYIPLVGQAVAATTGFAITYQAGSSYLNDCYKLAEEILKTELEISKK